MLPDPFSERNRLPWEDGLTIEPAGPDALGVSVVIPIYNAGEFLEKTLRSLMCNDLEGVEIILMDGGSTDDTQEICSEYEDLFAHMEFKKDRGQSHAINKGFARATKPLMYWLNGDDLILPNALTRIRHAFADSPDADVIVGDAYMVEKNLEKIRHAMYSPKTIQFDYLIDYAANHLIQPSVFFNRRAWEVAGPLREEMHYAMDADLFLAMARECQFVHLAEDIAYSVYHEECKTRLSRAESITELAMVQAKHGGMEQARKTLDILVDLYNAEVAAERVEKEPSITDVGPDPELLLRISAAREMDARRSHRLLSRITGSEARS